MWFVAMSAAVALSSHTPSVPAPPPRRVMPPDSAMGIVVAVDRESITIRGLFVDIDRATGTEMKWTDRKWTDRKRSEVGTGEFVVRSQIGLFKVDSTQEVVERIPATRVEFANGFMIGADAFRITRKDGTVCELRIEDQDPRTFEVSDLLRVGGYAPDLPPSLGATYRLTDVRVGDRVELWFRVSDVSCIVKGIAILRRPGGTIPPVPGLPENARSPRHEKMQAWQDWEDKGVPLPAKYHPGGPWPQLAPPPRPKP